MRGETEKMLGQLKQSWPTQGQSVCTQCADTISDKSKKSEFLGISALVPKDVLNGLLPLDFTIFNCCSSVYPLSKVTFSVKHGKQSFITQVYLSLINLDLCNNSDNGGDDV